MQETRLGRSFKIRMLHFGTKLLVFAIICGLVLGQTVPQYHQDPDRVVFPGPIGQRRVSVSSRSAEPPKRSELSKELELARKVAEVNSLEEFLKLFPDVEKSTDSSLFFESRIGAEERSNAEVPKDNGKCMPQLRPVSLVQEDDPSAVYYPPCTRVKRCGGCCGHASLSCQPTLNGVEVRNFLVTVIRIDPQTDAHSQTKVIVPVEEHTKCHCDCRIKAENCTEKQVYVEDECRCACANTDEEEKCKRNNQTKLWHPDNCSCMCRRVVECNTGFYFDQNTCRCQQLSLSGNWFSPSRGSNYDFEQTKQPENAPPVIVTLDAMDPRRKHKEDPEY